MDVVLLDCGFPEASRPVYIKRGAGWRGSGTLSARRETLDSFLKPFVCSLAFLAPARRRTGPREADRPPSLSVRSYAVLFFICCRYTAGRRIV
jgi:hypothetical protein